MSDHQHIFTGHGLDRATDRRTDRAWIEALRSAPEARFLLFQKAQPLVHLDTGGGVTEPVLLTAAALDRIEPGAGEKALFLGLDAAGAPLFAHAVPDDAAVGCDGAFEDVRVLGIQARIAPEPLARIGLARSLLEWHRYHAFCANCGAASEVFDGGAKRVCPKCGRWHFPRVDPVVIMLVHRGETCLLARQRHFTRNMYSALAGFIEAGESLEESVRREIMEETGVKVGRVRYHSSQPWPFPSALMIGCHAEGLSDDIAVDLTELEDARWFTREEARAMLSQNHTGGLFTPFSFAIAHHLIRAFADGTV
jgi:NAD+ diphosphatase